MTEDEVKKIGPKSTFDEILGKLQLTDRQKDIFILRYGRGWMLADISAELGWCRKTISEELSVIRDKMAQL